MTQHEGARAYCRNLWLKPFCTPSLGTSKGQIRTDCNISYLESAGGGGGGGGRGWLGGIVVRQAGFSQCDETSVATFEAFQTTA